MEIRPCENGDSNQEDQIQPRRSDQNLSPLNSNQEEIPEDCTAVSNRASPQPPPEFTRPRSEILPCCVKAHIARTLRSHMELEGSRGHPIRGLPILPADQHVRFSALGRGKNVRRSWTHASTKLIRGYVGDEFPPVTSVQ